MASIDLDNPPDEAKPYVELYERTQKELASYRVSYESLRQLGKCGTNNHGIAVGCGEAFVYRGEIYRCVDCGVEFHKACAQLHFANSGERQDQRRALELEVSDLRTAVIDLCDGYLSLYDRRKLVRKLRNMANIVSVPFSLDNVIDE